MVLRFHPDGDKELARWLEHCRPSDEDRGLVADVLRDVAAGMIIRWYHVSDTSDETVTIIEPREGLTVHVRLYGEVSHQFKLVRILPVSTIDPDEQEGP